MGNLSDDEQRRRLDLIDEVFRPSAPVNRSDLFSGRAPQLAAVHEAMRAIGQHAVIFGERGVGKTSLAATCAEYARARGLVAIRFNADEGDNFHSLWRKIIDEFPIITHEAPPDKRGDLEEATNRATEILMFDEVGPGQVRVALRSLTAVCDGVVVFIDEFDQVRDAGTLSLFSNTIKLLADQIEKVTLIPVGIADNVSDLIAAHLSVQRNLAQVRVPRMSREDLEAILDRGLEQLAMTANADARLLVRSLPRGFPTYAHMLAQEGGRHALRRSSSEITGLDVLRGLQTGLAKLDQSLAKAFDTATYTAVASRYADVLYACAIVTPDSDGFFSPAALRDPYSKIIGESVNIDRFNPQLTQLSQGRGQILFRKGKERARRYRFADPLMEAYVLLKGISENKITIEMLGRDPA